MKVCAEPGCPTLVDGSRCTDHERARDRARGSRQARGYGADHTRLRAEWEPCVATGTVRCWRCRDLIASDEAWHLGHDDHDRRVWRGPEHVACNLRAAGRLAHS